MAFIAAIVVAAVAAGASAYLTSENQAAQARAQQRVMNQQAQASREAGDARRRQVLYDAKRKMATLASREAAAGVQIGQGSLLEDEMQFSSDAEYSAQLAEYPYALATSVDAYSAKIYGAQAAGYSSQAIPGTLLASGSTLASGYASYASRQRPPTTTGGGWGDYL